ncbi:hypothetical protein DFJ74DRAFT_710438 [Hyaloraphidium curvatum]|nr:hypothetical protein DFJ74DRAFT_710438 [Hyaloraphidium curvatum]
MDEANSNRLSLTEAETAALFPLRAPSGPAAFPHGLNDIAGEKGEPSEPDTAPPSVDAVVAALAPLSPNLAGLVQLAWTAGRLNLADLRAAAMFSLATSISITAAAALAFKVNDGTFPERNIAASVSGVSVFWVVTVVIQIAILLAFAPPKWRRTAGDGMAANLAGARNWARAIKAGSALLDHVDGDPACPCRSCCSGVVSWMFWERILRIVPLHMLGTFFFVTMTWTTVVHFGPVFWGAWWGILVGTVAMVAGVLYNLSSVLYRCAGPSPAETSLSTRIYLRASSRALRDFLQRSQRRLLAGTIPASSDPSGPAVGAPELYAILHLSYKRRWILHRRFAFGSNPFISLAAWPCPPPAW